MLPPGHERTASYVIRDDFQGTSLLGGSQGRAGGGGGSEWFVPL